MNHPKSSPHLHPQDHSRLSRCVAFSEAMQELQSPWGGNGSAPSAGYHLCHRPQTWCFGGLCSIGLGCNTIIHMWTHPCVHIYSYVIFITMVHEVLALTGRHNQSCWADALVFVFFESWMCPSGCRTTTRTNQMGPHRTVQTCQSMDEWWA